MLKEGMTSHPCIGQKIDIPTVLCNNPNLTLNNNGHHPKPLMFYNQLNKQDFLPIYSRKIADTSFLLLKNLKINVA